jgi:hypothetical protein
MLSTSAFQWISYSCCLLAISFVFLNQPSANTLGTKVPLNAFACCDASNADSSVLHKAACIVTRNPSSILGGLEINLTNYPEIVGFCPRFASHDPLIKEALLWGATISILGGIVALLGFPHVMLFGCFLVIRGAFLEGSPIDNSLIIPAALLTLSLTIRYLIPIVELRYVRWIPSTFQKLK